MEAGISGAFIVGRVRIRDPAKWVAYRDAVGSTLTPFEGTVVARGNEGVVLTGRTDDTDVVVIRFPSMASIEAWYRSPAYQALIPLRDEAADVVIVGYRV